jgi:hypothetical protein
VIAAVEDLITLQSIAAMLRMGRDGVRKLRAMSLRGKFPDVLAVTPRHCLVRRVDFENWKAGRWTTEMAVRSAMVVDASKGEKVSNKRKRAKAGG